ncbi:hypothetical protein [Actinomadura rubrisoli]|uniref:DUF8017 domain-containing protein n=1 Tax=Actinomadura rubrisoli TaxID=2530368 RepID=A0A4R5ASM2_9ACTN|nr:hypothetical protein [Actinomadura rubrisoli]TDD73412.1 hypothetical protein E1298_34095 [Actinomadura rubrisoli]
MKGDKGPDRSGGDAPGNGGGDGERWSNPYPLPGQDWDTPGDDSSPPFFQDTPPPAPMPLGKGAPPPDARFPLGGRSVAAEKRRLWTVFAPFLIAIMLPVLWGGYKIYGLYSDTANADDPRALPTASEFRRTPEPEPVSTVRPRVKGWKAVTSAKYGLTYDVPAGWQIKDPELLIGFEGADGRPSAAMSATAVFREGYCKHAERAATGFNQYVEGGLKEVARHAANKWATNAYTPDDGQAPVVMLRAPEAVRVGRARAVHVRAAVVPKNPGSCGSPSAIVDAVAVPGTGPGKTTVFVLFSDQGVPDAAPVRDLAKILGSLRPS